ncbi:MAG: hypothetical protein Tsb0034_27290 [Ekhidna sp.]
MAQQKFTKTWNDTMMKSDFILRYSDEKEGYVFKGEKYEKDQDYGVLATGSIDRIRQVIAQMDSAFQSKDPKQLFALGRYKYSYAELEINDLMLIEALRIEDLLKDETGQTSVYVMTSATLSKIREFVDGIE